MPSGRCLFIYNPVSGRGKTERKTEYILSALRNKYAIVESYATVSKGDMSRVIAERANEYEAIVFSGGDGSFNEAVHGLCKSGAEVEVGYIPGGTVNDIAHSLGIPKNIRKAVKVICTGKNALLDCMKINDRYAMYVAAAGAFTSAPYSTPQLNKKLIGRFAYGIEGIRKNLKFRVFHLKVAQAERITESDVVFAALMNGRFVAGMGMNWRASMSDGKIEAAFIRQHPSPNFLHRVRAVLVLCKLFLFGYRVKEKQIIRVTGSHFEIETDEDIVWTFDGEKGVSGKISVDVLPQRINMIVPKNKKRI